MTGEVEQWESAIACEGRVVVLEETTSTQDAAIALKLQAGDVCGALVQTSGRGRRGNAWDGTGGVAITVVLEEAPPELSIAVAAVLAEQLEACIEHAVGIKWPNDLFVEGQKLAGILIEQHGDVCLVGVGINVAKKNYPNAVSLQELGADVDRSCVAGLIVSSIFSALGLSAEAAVSLWQTRDILVGTTQSFISNNNSITGTVLAIDPLHNLLLDTKSGPMTLLAAATTFNSEQN